MFVPYVHSVFLGVKGRVLHLHELCFEMHYLYIFPYTFWDLMLLGCCCCPLVGRTSFSLNFAFRFEVGVEFEVLKSIRSVNKQVEKLSCSLYLCQYTCTFHSGSHSKKMHQSRYSHMGKGTDHIKTFMYCIHARLTTSDRVVTLSEIIIFLPKLSDKEDLERLESQWDLPVSIILRMRTLAMRLQFKVSHILSWFNTSWQLSTTQPLAHSSPCLVG